MKTIQIERRPGLSKEEFNREYVEGNLGELVKDQDLSRYIL